MKGVVSAGHKLTAEAGMEMLRCGGNAFDAALAASFASFVCESPLTSIGGGGFFMAHTSAGDTLLYDFFPNVPGLGREAGKEELDFYPVDIDFTGTIQEFHVGRGSVAVPGCMAGFDEVFKRHCTLPLKTIMEPAIHYARDGVELNAQQAYFNRILSPILTLSPEGRSVYSPYGPVLVEGDRIFKKEMAATMVHMAEEGLKSFYSGELGAMIVDQFGETGLLTKKDLESYSVQVRKPLSLSYRGKRIFLNPPPSSSGGCLIAFSLKLLERFDLAAMGHNSSAYLELLCSVMQTTDEARGEDFDHRVYEDGIAETFLCDERVERYAGRIKEGGMIKDDLERPSTGNTTHISILDGEGNAASITTSNGEGCGHIISGAGIMLNNMLGEEDINPHGFHKQKPGTRMSSMMAPAIVMDGGLPYIVLGSGGSNRIRNAILQVLVNLIDHQMPVFEAVNSARAHWDKKAFQVEDGIEPQSLVGLEDHGISINRWKEKNMYFGGVHTAVTLDNGKSLSGGGDLRRGGICLVN